MVVDRPFDLFRSISNILIDLRYGGWLRGSEPTKFRHLGAYGIGNVSYNDLSHIFPDGTIGAHDVLVDLGCGKGRVLNWWLKQYGGRNQLIGIEIDPYWADRTRHRLSGHASCTVIQGNVLDILPGLDAQVFFMFNPFNEPVMKGVETILRGKNVRLFYYLPKHISVWQNGHWDIETKSMPNPEHYYPLAVIRSR